MNRGVARIVIIVVLAVVGGLVLANGFGDDGVSAADPTPTTTPSGLTTPSDTSTPTTPPPGVEPQPPEEVTFMALNATDEIGLGAEAQALLEAAGYVHATPEAANAPTSGAETTSVLYRGGDGKAQNKANARFISREYFPGSNVALLSEPDYAEVVPDDATVVVVAGLDFRDEIAA